MGMGIVKTHHSAHHIWYLLPFLLLGLAIYSNTLEVPFYFDDLSNIVENTHIRLSRFTVEGLKEAAFQGLSSSRPVANISFALNYLVHGYDKEGYHIVNIFVHILSGIFLYLFIRRTLCLSSFGSAKISNPSIIAFCGAVIWFVHPVHTQSVTYVVQRMNSLASMFYILSFLLYVHGRLKERSRSKWAWFLGAAFVGMLSAGSKQIAVTLPFFILLYEWYFFHDLKKAWARKFVAYLIGPIVVLATLAYFYIGVNPLRILFSTSGDVEFSAVERLLTQFRVVIYYISLLFYPHPSRLNLDYDFIASRSLIDPITTFFSLMAVIGLFGLALYLAKRDRLMSFCILWFLGNLVLESFVAGLEMVYEHRTYLPSMLIFLPIVLLGYKYWKRKKLALVAVAIIVVVFSMWTYERNNIWLDPIAFWRSCAEKSIQKARPCLNLASALASRGRVDEAIPHYEEALRRRPGYEHAHIGLGSALVRKGRLDEALSHYLEALRIRPEHAMVHYGLGVVYSRRGDFDEAIVHYGKAVQIRPDHVKALNGLGVALAKQGRLDEAISYYRKALRVDPEHEKARRNLRNILMMSERSGQTDVNRISAEAGESGGVKALNARGETHYNLGVVLVRLNRLDEARDHYLQAIRLRPEYVEAHNNVGIVFGRQGQLDKAVEHFTKALRVNPDFAEARKNLQRAQSLRGQQ